MTRNEARNHLKGGGELDGLVLTAQGRVVARGKIRWTDTILSATEDARCTGLQLQRAGERLDVPLVEAVSVKRGEPIQIEFGPAWQGQQRRA
jgi:hypothetical protein